MAREYAAFYDSVTNTHKVIAKDEFDGYWFNHITEDLGGTETAKLVAQALNTQENRRKK